MLKEKVLLIVDDDPDVVETLKFRLEADNYKIIVAYDGKEALAKARQAMPDLILLDLMLPELDGYKVCRLLKFDEKYRGIPIIMLTARAQEADKTQGIETGADRYMTKPYDYDKLRIQIGELLKEDS